MRFELVSIGFFGWWRGFDKDGRTVTGEVEGIYCG